MRPDPFNEFQARAQRERERAKRRADSEEGLRRQHLDVGMVVMVIVCLVALLIFFLAITPSWTW
ncbi:hypothetical protein SK854_01105 [Lentzea sp. BCCO 10_0061]|uniref:Uncharacterized protein n=1 Tax=Lentzea sokolovensis TaxID=3095429 RepID=A0ABU4UPQ1_9PSEU|nr:hypothetical protein [Lentzea sp. BCCO 10_0061]MDX8140690.1 hypothetical protein [Lentzea sp. BCCO 10_0061]